MDNVVLFPLIALAAFVIAARLAARRYRRRLRAARRALLTCGAVVVAAPEGPQAVRREVTP